MEGAQLILQLIINNTEVQKETEILVHKKLVEFESKSYIEDNPQAYKPFARMQVFLRERHYSESL